MMRLSSTLLSASAAGALILVTATAAAQTSRKPSAGWQKGGNKDGEQGSSQNFAFELRFGAYSPQIDKEPKLMSAGVKPYEHVFNSKPQFYIGLELDYLPLRIPYVGYIGPGFGWGRTRTSTKAKLSSDHKTLSDVTVGLTIMPMHLSGVLRVDEFMRRWGVPIVPFAKLGFGFGTWSADNDAGTETFMSGKDTIKASGVAYGLHAALGGMVSLNWIDRSAAASLDETTSVNHIYLFGEWMNNSHIGRTSKGMYIGTSTWVLGLALDI
jgi:hypothetical protein